jgi:hypothetical protein
MTAGASEPGRIDPRLVKHFALFREPGPGPDGPLDEADKEVLALRAEVASGSSHAGLRLASYGLVFGEARRVELNPERVMLVIPGSGGVQMLVRSSKRHEDGRSFDGTAGSVTGIDGLIDGRPILSAGRTLFGLAPDGVELQRVEFRDGSTGEALVRHNTYMINDPSWSSD